MPEILTAAVIVRRLVAEESEQVCASSYGVQSSTENIFIGSLAN